MKNIKPEIRVFLDTSALFAGIWSAEGGGRMILKLGEAGVIQILLGSRVLAEIEDVLRRKAPQNLGSLAMLLDRCRAIAVQDTEGEYFPRCLEWIKHPGDARVLAEALSAHCDYFVTLDRAHLLGNKRLVGKLPFEMGTPGDFLAWLRRRLEGLT